MHTHNVIYSDETAMKVRDVFESIYRKSNVDRWTCIEVALERRGNHYIEAEVDEAYFMFAQGYLTCLGFESCLRKSQ